MKNLILTATAASLLVIGAASCSTSTGQPEFETLKKEAAFKLEIPDSLKMDSAMQYYSTARAELLVLKDAPALDSLLMRFAFPDDSTSNNWNAALAQFASTPIEFLQTKSTPISAAPAADTTNMILSKTVKCDTIGHLNDLLTFRITHEGYLGGAHGYFSRSFVNYDLRKQAVETADSLFANKVAIRSLIIKQLTADNKLQSPRQLEENAIVFSVADIQVPANFYFEDDNVVFYYNPYEIGSWAQGEVNVKVPFSALRQYLTDYGKQLLQ